MRIYVTKYVLSGGIKEMEADECDSRGAVVCTCVPSLYLHGKEFWFHRHDAVKDALRRIDAKMKALQRQEAKLHMMERALRRELAQIEDLV
jgi:hypothetical protein